MGRRDEGFESTALTRRSVMRAAFGTSAGVIVPISLDLNATRTMAQATESAPDPARLSPQGPDQAVLDYPALVERAKALAAQPYRPAADDLPAELGALTYDQYQAIGFRPEKTLLLGRFGLQPFHRGFLQRKRVALLLQKREGGVQALDYASELFDLGPSLKGRSYPAALGYAGFRLSFGFDAGAPQVREEFLVFLGASYFRLRGRTDRRPASCRGVAVNTGGPGEEEFPDFTEFRILEPAAEETRLTILALLDGPSLTGAYRFTVSPGEETQITVTASLHPRRSIPRLGLAPLTSMFLHGQNGAGARGAQGFDDFRPQVHDSDGLCVASPGDRLWRPLVNGRAAPQISAFRAAPCQGFGLMQRERHFAAYLDVQARHEDRPGIWIAPEKESLGAGSVQLYEIPSRDEAIDNIVAAFVPEAPVTAGRPIDLAYTLATVGEGPDADLPRSLARVVSTRVGSAERLRPTNPPSPERRLYAIDFEGPDLPQDPMSPIAVSLWASAGAFLEPFCERVPQTGGWRLYAEYRPPHPLPPGDVVLRARLSHAGKPITETWDAVA